MGHGIFPHNQTCVHIIAGSDDESVLLTAVKRFDNAHGTLPSDILRIQRL